jgi:hypothetical protein
VIEAALLVMAGLLLVSGLEKAARPRSAATALHRAGAPWPFAAARGLALVEVVTGSAALVWGGRLASIAVGAVYVGFSCFLLWRRRIGDLGTPCGCFGEDVPIGGQHLVVDIAGVAVATAAVMADTKGFLGLARDSAAPAGVTALLVATGVFQLRLVLTRLGTLLRPALAEVT